MTDLPPDLPRLRTLETWLQLSLDRVRQKIRAAEQREAERRHGDAHRPAPPAWLIELGPSKDTMEYVHVGSCWSIGRRSRGIDREQARRALADGVKACPQCKPDTALGMLE